MEVSGVLFDVRFERYEIVVDERSGLIVLVRFSFQPNASSSRRRGAEINQ